MTFKQQSLLANSISFAQVDDIQDVVKFTVNTQPKNLSGISCLHNRAEIVRTKKSDVTKGSLVGTDQLSIRVIISGVTASDAALSTLWTEVKSQVDAAMVAGIAKGFVPSDIIINPV